MTPSKQPFQTSIAQVSCVLLETVLLLPTRDGGQAKKAYTPRKPLAAPQANMVAASIQKLYCPSIFQR
jgi:hypothetical protein